MQIDVGAYIGELLFQHDSVNVPGLGGFVSKPKSSTIDQVQGNIHPPSQDLNFNKNLVVNDGLLVNFIKNKHDLSFTEAQQAVETYVEKVKSAIDRKEIVVFPELGRLYKDYEQNLQFLPDNTNFNTDSFGLPVVQFYPVLRTGGEETDQKTPTKNNNKNKFTSGGIISQTISSWFQKYIAIIGVLSVLIVGAGAFLLYNHNKDNGGGETASVPTARVNVSPTDTQENDQPGTVEEDLPSLDTDSQKGQEDSTEPNPPVDTEGPTTRPEQKSAVISIGIFGNPDNIEKLVKRIYEAGYEAYTEERNQYTIVGVQLAYNEEKDLEDALRDVREKFEENAKIIKK